MSRLDRAGVSAQQQDESGDPVTGGQDVLV